MATDASATVSASADRPMSSRIVGIDIARALAILGMFAVHFGPTNGAGPLARVYAAPHGRASILFVVVAGAGVALMAASPRTTLGDTGWRLTWRAALLLPLGLALQELEHGAHVILQGYAVLFVAAIIALRLPDRWLLSLAGVIAVLGPFGFWYGQAVAPEVFDRSATTLTDPAAAVVQGLVLTGPYPLITWLAPFLFGLWLGRQDLRATRLRLRMVVGGGAVAITAAVTARTLIAVLGQPAGIADARYLATSAAHSQMPLWLIGATGAATFVFGVALLAASRLGRWLVPLAALGQLALTIYVAHLVALHLAPARLTSDRVGQALLTLAVFTGVCTVAAVAWRSAFERGPLEALFRPPWQPSGRVAYSPRAASRSSSAWPL